LKPSEVTYQHLEALNLEILPLCSIEALVPSAPDGTSYVPSLAIKPAAPVLSYAQASQANPNTAKRRQEFEERLAELKVDNDTAFRVITRTYKDGSKPPRLAYMRKFWAGLENMSQYWDCSLDQYYEVVTGPDEEGTSPKRQCFHANKLRNSKSFPSSTPSAEQVNLDLRVFQSAMEVKVNGLRPDSPSAQRMFAKPRSPPFSAVTPADTDRAMRSSSASPEPRPRMRYKGRRTSTGQEMPNEFRSETVRAFVEGTIWPFQCSIAAPRHMPMVQLGKLIFPVRQTAAVYRVPQDRTRARQGQLEGPMMIVQVRPDGNFTDGAAQSQEIKSTLDLLREVGGLLQIAQERRREGTKQEKPGEGEWWTIKPRWGGGAGGEIANEIGNADIVEAAEELLGGMRDSLGGRVRKKKTPAMLWKEVKCGSGFWDPKVSTCSYDCRRAADNSEPDRLHRYWQAGFAL